MNSLETKILNEANYCLSCALKPCQTGCPLSNDTAGFIKLVKQNRYKDAYELLCKTTLLPSLCGRVCPHSKQCQGKCVRGIKGEPVQIGKIESFIGDLAIKEGWQIPHLAHVIEDKKIAVVGSGPASLTCAGFLRAAGFSVTIFEKYNELGGLFAHGIPNFRLSPSTVQAAIQKIINLGIEVKTNMTLGKDFSLESLKSNYDAVFLGIGANVSGKMNIPGENLKNVLGANEFLENQPQIDLKGKVVAVSGGGNVAMDIARTAVRLGAKHVIIIYRRSENEMPAEQNEIEDAKAEGVELLTQHNILACTGSTKLEGLELIKTKLVKKENDTRLSPVNIAGSNYQISADYLFMAVGSSPEFPLTSTLGLELDDYGKIKIDENCQTTDPMVFAGGDVSTHKKSGTVAWAAVSGRKASEAIIKFLEKTQK